MLESMTGYGRGEHTSENIRAIVEIRSVNYRYSEISMKLPSHLQIYEQPLREVVQRALTRGKISLTADVDFKQAAPSEAHIREEALEQKIGILEKVRWKAGIEEPLKLEHLLVFEELFEETENDPEVRERQYMVLARAVETAVEELIKMRRHEGANLQKDLAERMRLLRTLCDHIRDNEKERIPEARKRLNDRLEHLIDDGRVDQDRLEQEIAIIADRLDISEELVRMDSHISYFTECIENSSSQGKKLNFILQEMHREVNTIGSKANDSEISRKVVDMKEIIENIREQIQNIA
ncbi:YicC family protein [Balneolales bacterium ANBcel1]|nr:YicC family protein [Balneolales bacterium ANBcel1]